MAATTHTVLTFGFAASSGVVETLLLGFGIGEAVASDPLILTVTRSFTARTRTDEFSGRTVTRTSTARTRTDTLSG